MTISVTVSFEATDNETGETLASIPEISYPTLDYADFLEFQHALFGGVSDQMYNFAMARLSPPASPSA